MRIHFAMTLAAALTACAQPAPYFPLNKGKYASENDARLAMQIASNKCKALALNSAPRQPDVSNVSQTNVLIVNPRSQSMPLPASRLDTSRINSDGMNAFDRGVAAGEREQAMASTYAACMNAEGFAQ